VAQLPRALPAPVIAARVAIYGFFAALAALVVVAFDPVIPENGAAAVARLVVGLVLLGEGALLALRRAGARRAVVERLLRRMGRSGGWGVLLGPLVLGAGLIFAGFGAYELVRAAETAL
jgi:hypothetical protein